MRYTNKRFLLMPPAVMERFNRLLHHAVPKEVLRLRHKARGGLEDPIDIATDEIQSDLITLWFLQTPPSGLLAATPIKDRVKKAVDDQNRALAMMKADPQDRAGRDLYADASVQIKALAQELLPGIRTQEAEEVVRHYYVVGQLEPEYIEQLQREGRYKPEGPIPTFTPPPPPAVISPQKPAKFSFELWEESFFDIVGRGEVDFTPPYNSKKFWKVAEKIVDFDREIADYKDRKGRAEKKRFNSKTETSEKKHRAEKQRLEDKIDEVEKLKDNLKRSLVRSMYLDILSRHPDNKLASFLVSLKLGLVNPKECERVTLPMVRAIANSYYLLLQKTNVPQYIIDDAINSTVYNKCRTIDYGDLLWDVPYDEDENGYILEMNKPEAERIISRWLEFMEKWTLSLDHYADLFLGFVIQYLKEKVSTDDWAKALAREHGVMQHGQQTTLILALSNIFGGYGVEGLEKKVDILKQLPANLKRFEEVIAFYGKMLSLIVELRKLNDEYNKDYGSISGHDLPHTKTQKEIEELRRKLEQYVYKVMEPVALANAKEEIQTEYANLEYELRLVKEDQTSKSADYIIRNLQPMGTIKASIKEFPYNLARPPNGKWLTSGTLAIRQELIKENWKDRIKKVVARSIPEGKKSVQQDRIDQMDKDFRKYKEYGHTSTYLIAGHVQDQDALSKNVAVLVEDNGNVWVPDVKVIEAKYLRFIQQAVEWDHIWSGREGADTIFFMKGTKVAAILGPYGGRSILNTFTESKDAQKLLEYAREHREMAK